MLVETENFASIRPQTIGQKEDPLPIGRKKRIEKEAQSKIENPKPKILSLSLASKILTYGSLKYLNHRGSSAEFCHRSQQ